MNCMNYFKMKRRKQNDNSTYSSWCTTGSLMLNELSSLKCGVSMSESDQSELGSAVLDIRVLSILGCGIQLAQNHVNVCIPLTTCLYKSLEMRLRMSYFASSHNRRIAQLLVGVLRPACSLGSHSPLCIMPVIIVAGLYNFITSLVGQANGFATSFYCNIKNMYHWLGSP